MERDFDVDYSERAGFLTGKAAAIADWQHRKDKREFAKLVHRLRLKKWRASAAGKAWTKAYWRNEEVKTRQKMLRAAEARRATEKAYRERAEVKQRRQARLSSEAEKAKRAAKYRAYLATVTPEQKALDDTKQRERWAKHVAANREKRLAYARGYAQRPENKARANEQRRAAYHRRRAVEKAREG